MTIYETCPDSIDLDNITLEVEVRNQSSCRSIGKELSTFDWLIVAAWLEPPHPIEDSIVVFAFLATSLPMSQQTSLELQPRPSRGDPRDAEDVLHEKIANDVQIASEVQCVRFPRYKRRCQFCNVLHNRDVKLLKCACRQARYCDRSCQKMDCRH